MQMPVQLNRTLFQGGFTLPGSVRCGPLGRFPEKVLQFGEGNFLRAFFDWMVDETNERGMFGGHVVVAQPIRTGSADRINEQEGLYTLIARGVEEGKVVETRRVIASISRAINPYEEWDKMTALARSPELRFVVSNTTEAGIVYVEESYVRGCCPASFPAKVTALLFERFQALNEVGPGADRAPSGGLVFLQCELIERNGDKLKEYVHEHAKAWKLGEGFGDWLQSANYFLNTLVDRIVPGYPRAEAASLAAELGYEDQLVDSAEIFHLWVIEGPGHLADELPFHRAGLNVIWTDDMSPYRTRKVRILNGAHTASVLAAYLGGINTVREMMADGLFKRFVRQAVFDEIIPALAMKESEARQYANAVLERFQNPFIKHELLSISLNSVSKWKVRVLPSLLDYLSKTGKIPAALAFSLAALIRFYEGRASGAGLTGEREGEAYPIRDDADVLDFFQSCSRAFEINADAAEMARTILGNESLWGMDLTSLPGLAGAVTRCLQTIHGAGMRKAVESILDTRE